MMPIIVAAVIAASLYLSANGVLWAAQLLIAILATNILLVIYSIAFLGGFQKTMLKNSEKRIKELEEAYERHDHRTVILIRLLLLIAVWHLYTLGYVLFAGVAGTTVAISLLVALLRSIDMAEEKKE